MDIDLKAALGTFVAESRELLQDMEASLLAMEAGPTDPEAIRAIFRTAHTIKGSAGLFGLDRIVAFAHVLENLLDRVRSGETAVTPDMVAILLSSCDHMGMLVEHLASSGSDPGPHEADLIGKLRAFMQDAQESAPWHISIRFGRDVYREGMEPTAFLNYLETLGHLVSVVPLMDAMPPAMEMDPESCYLGLELRLVSDASKEDIARVFEFIEGESLIRILPPQSKAEEYIALIRSRPEEPARLGEILVQCGAVTRRELESALSIQATPGATTNLAPLGQILLEQRAVPDSVLEVALDQQNRTKTANRENRLIRIDADRLDHLISLLGELVIAGASTELHAMASANPDWMEASSLMTRLLSEVRDHLLRLRLVQIGGTFNRFQRIARDVSQELGKDIELIISGGETELDKSVIDRIGDPLIHLVRNAMDHGIELPAERQAKGKPIRGTVKLNAYHHSGSVVIEVSDDGGGLKRDRVLQKGIERGLVPQGEALSDREIFNLIFEPGFSTAEQVTNLSGRGVGMDVVRRDIEALRGAIELDSREGLGTTVRIRLPLTLAIIEGFLVKVGESFFVVPMELVNECVDRRRVHASAGRRYVEFRGEVLPFIRLREVLELEGPQPERESIVVVRFGSKRMGLVVDELLGEFQTVIKPLGQMFAHLQGIGGATILASGEVALILDVPALVQRVMELSR